jgi:hypothetical protein
MALSGPSRMSDNSLAVRSIVMAAKLRKRIEGLAE